MNERTEEIFHQITKYEYGISIIPFFDGFALMIISAKLIADTSSSG